MKIDEIKKLLVDEGLDKSIVVDKLRDHNKASEKYIDLTFIQPDGFKWSTSIPYFYRRTGLVIEHSNELVDYLKLIYTTFTKEKINDFKKTEVARWKNEMSGKETTKGFFDKLIGLAWCSVKDDFPNNPNWARRIQDIKDFGYTLSTDTNKNHNGTHILLVPIPKGGVTGYEVMSAKFRAKVIKTLNEINVYELKSSNKQGLLPDHKFPEIRWDEDTLAENSEEMSEKEIKEKFQLIDNQRNQQKREVCRKCFQTDKRGKLFGINYFYKGNENWPDNVPKMGKVAEEGCVGCGWYDIEAWRDSLNNAMKN